MKSTLVAAVYLPRCPSQVCASSIQVAHSGWRPRPSLLMVSGPAVPRPCWPTAYRWSSTGTPADRCDFTPYRTLPYHCYY